MNLFLTVGLPILAIALLIAIGVIIAALWTDDDSDGGLFEHKWERNRFPLYVDVLSMPLPLELEYIAREAAAWWNNQLGFEAFTFEDVPGLGQVYVVDVTDVKSWELQHATALGTGKLYTQPGNISRVGFAEVAIHWGRCMALAPPRRFHTLAHEYGHILGLRHDTCTCSVMFGSVKGARTRTEESDLEALKKEYGPTA